jgi:hypothetical protein
LEAEQIARIIRESIKEELGTYKMPKEQHYTDHQWIKKKQVNEEKIEDWTKKGVVGLVLSAIGGLIYLGFIMLGKTHIK